MMKAKGVDAMAIKRIRSIPEAVKEIKMVDPNTSVSEYCVRQLVINGIVPASKVGRKFMIDLDVLQAYLGGEA